MKRKTARYVSECDNCQKVKADYVTPRVMVLLFTFVKVLIKDQIH
jgi:hypothetical protein